jgi:hypothetical protein
MLEKWIEKDGFLDCVSSEEMETRKTKLLTTKKCPKCRTLIEKESGCISMVCGNPVCKYKFCWFCRFPAHGHESTCNRPKLVEDGFDFDIHNTEAVKYFGKKSDLVTEFEELKLQKINNITELIKNIQLKDSFKLTINCLSTIAYGHIVVFSINSQKVSLYLDEFKIKINSLLSEGRHIISIDDLHIIKKEILDLNLLIKSEIMIVNEIDENASNDIDNIMSEDPANDITENNGFPGFLSSSTISPGFGTQPPFFGASPPRFGATAPRFGAQPPGFGAQPPGFGAQPPGFGAQPPGFGAQPPGFGAQPPGFGVEPRVFGAQPPGFGTTPRLFGAEPRGFGAPVVQPAFTFGEPSHPMLAGTGLMLDHGTNSGSDDDNNY